MYPRWSCSPVLRRGREYWISIDDDECHYLKVICDEVFGFEERLCG
jgi:adenine-specific DNA-methyltransferase